MLKKLLKQRQIPYKQTNKLKQIPKLNANNYTRKKMKNFVTGTHVYANVRAANGKIRDSPSL